MLKRKVDNIPPCGIPLWKIKLCPFASEFIMTVVSTRNNPMTCTQYSDSVIWKITSSINPCFTESYAFSKSMHNTLMFFFTALDRIRRALCIQRFGLANWFGCNIDSRIGTPYDLFLLMYLTLEFTSSVRILLHVLSFAVVGNTRLL